MSNKGAAGVDQMNVEQLKPYLQEHWAQIREELLKGQYQPQPVRSVEIPKPQGGMRQLGIPTVVDRLIQQALHQVLSPIFEPGFFRIELRVSPPKKRASGGATSTRLCGERTAVGRGLRFGEILRPGQPRYLDVAVGAANQRQTGAAA